MLKIVVMKLIAPRIEEAPRQVQRQDHEIDRLHRSLHPNRDRPSVQRRSSAANMKARGGRRDANVMMV
jgi:hypothetical protein